MAALTRKDKNGLALMGGVLAVLAAVLLLAINDGDRLPAGPDNCHASVKAKTVILIDGSDVITAQGSEEIVRRSLDFVREHVGVDERVSIFEVTDVSQRSLKPRFSACKPPATGNRLNQDTRAVEKKFVQSFQKPLEDALAASGAESSVSPISEAVIDLSLSDYLRAERSNLLVFSDLLQHSRNTSLYGCSSGRAAIADFRAHRAGAMERPVFRNTGVYLNIVPREGLGHSVVRCRDGFWQWFFGDNSGPGAGLQTSFLPGGAVVQ